MANILILCITILGFAWYSASLQTKQKIQNDREQLIIFTKNIAALAAKYLQLNEYDQLETKIYQLIQYPGVNNILILNNETHYALSVKIRPDQTVYTDTAPDTPAPPNKGDQLIQKHKDSAVFWQRIHIDKTKDLTGWARVEYDTRYLTKISTQIFKRSLSIALIAILLSLLALKKLLSKPLLELRRASEFAEYLDLSQGSHIEISKSSEEIEQLLRALNRTSEKLHRQEESQKSSALLLDTIREIQSQFISEFNVPVVFESLMSRIVQLTKSEFGFFGEVLLAGNNKPYLKMSAISHLVSNKRGQEFYGNYDLKNLKFKNMNNLIGAVIQTKKPVIANDVATDPRRGGLPEGHPNISTFLGLPVFSGERVIGVVGIANRVDGYDQGIVAYLQPLLSTCSHMIEGYRNELNRKQIQDELKRTNANLNTILNSVSDGIITITQEGNISSVNVTAASMFTYNTDTMIDGRIGDYISGLEYRGGKFYVNGESIYIQGCNEKIKWRMEARHKDGHGFPVEISVSEYKQGHEYSYTITVRSLENDVGTHSIKDDLITTFDKELKETLGSIRGSLMLLKGRVVGELSESVDDMIGAVYNSTERLIGLVDNVKDINRIESGEIELHIKPLDIEPFVDRVLSSNQDICRQYSISFQTAGDIDHTILGDEERLLQVVRYLVTTAAGFCSPDGALEFSTRSNKDMVELAVVGYAKQGGGEFMKQCLCKFGHLYNTKNEPELDRDFTLYLCRAIVDHHGGKLGCESLSDRSVRLYIQIPIYGQAEHVANM